MKYLNLFRIILLYANILITVAACQPGGADSHSDEPTKSQGPRAFVCSIKGGASIQPMLCLQQACDQVGGTYDHKAQVCQCKAGLYFTGWEYPACKPFLTDLNCYHDAAGSANCFASLVNDGAGQSLGAVVLQLAQSSSATGDFNRLQSQIPDWNDVRWSPHLNRRMGNRVFVYGAGKLHEKQVRELVDPAPPQGFNRLLGGLAPQDEYFYLATKEDLQLLWRGQDSFSQSLAEIPKDNVPGELWKNLKQTHKQAETQWLELSETFSSLGCLGYCRLQGQSALSAGWTMIQTLEYFGGVPGRRLVKVYDAQNNLKSSLILSAKGMISVVLLFQQNITGEDMRQGVQLYNRYGSLIGQWSETTFSLKKLSATQGHLRVVQKKWSVDVAVCDGGFAPEDFLVWPLKGTLQLGPSANSNPLSQQSYYGWTARSDARSFADGLVEIGDFGFRQRQGQNLSEHGRDVSQILITPRPYGVIPLSIHRCDNEADFQNLAPQLKGRVRVINFSASSERQGDACELFALHPINGSGRDFLWIVAAGNGRLRDQEQLKSSCPQRFSGKKNVIVVAASQGEDIHYESNAHPEFADIAAPGEGPDQRGWGTSFAAPRVTQLAAQIIEKYPRLNNEQVRLAILLGAKHSRGLPVRSEGILSSKESFAIAKGLYEEGLERLPEILSDVYCTFINSECEMQQQKLNIYRSQLF